MLVLMVQDENVGIQEQRKKVQIFVVVVFVVVAVVVVAAVDLG